MVIGVILAAGKGTRINSKKVNKTAFLFNNKPIIQYGIDLFDKITDKTIVVVGAYAKSIKKILKGKKIYFSYQKNLLGTGEAVKSALQKIDQLKFSSNLLLVGCGDHLMFYKQNTIKKLIKKHQEKKAQVSLITVFYDQPDKLAWGRIIRDEKGLVIGIVEQKEADQEIKKIKELNAGFYCFNTQFLRGNINKIKKSPLSGEYYLTDLVKIAQEKNNKIVSLKVPFQEVGIGINTQEQLDKSERLYKKFKER